jgi:mRNA interferase YafQ
VAKRKLGASSPERPEPEPRPLEAIRTAKFKQDVERQRQRGKDVAKLRVIIGALCHRRPLDLKQSDHALTRDWKGWRDCHVEPDWVLIYKQDDDKLILGRTGTHSDLKL